MSLTAFRRIQYAQETTRGTDLAAEGRLIGTLLVDPTFNTHRPRDERGSLAENRRIILVNQGADLRYEGDTTYQQILHFLAMGVRGGIAGVLDAGAAYNWTFTPLLTARNNQNAYTLEFGDDTQAFQCNFVMARALELGFALGEPTRLVADMFGRAPAATTFTVALSNPTVNEIVSNNLQIWIDGAWANLGATAKNSLVMGGTVRLGPTGVVPVKYADGTLDFSNFLEQPRHLEIELELAMGTDGMTEYNAWRQQTARAIRLLWTGPALEGGNHTFRIDTFGYYAEGPQLFGERDGQDIVRLVFHSFEDASGNEMDFRVRTNISAIT